MNSKESKPLISVIVPVHNGQEFLESCVDSIIRQTYPAIQIIIVDDGSTDNTPAVCQKICETYETTKLITMEDLGVSAARNRGIDAADGEYITFVDADDRIHPKMLEILQDNLEETKSDFAGCSFFAWQTPKDWEMNINLPVQNGGRREFTAEQFVLDAILVNDTRCWSKLYRRSCFDKAGFRDGLTIGEDMMLLVDLVPHMKKAVSVDFKGYGYFQNPQGAMNRRFKPSYMDQIRCWKLAGEQLQSWASTNKRLTDEQKASITQVMAARLMTGIMLTAGKLAELGRSERKIYEEYVAECHNEIRACHGGKVRIFRMFRKNREIKLGYGYCAKICAFALAPRSYLTIYGVLKKMTKH